ncbi:MAG: hypothetical protein HYV97_08900 [Bdellovibrio sp.]|nr:hypothetical protein [Bdellovibrio sp.]
MRIGTLDPKIAVEQPKTEKKAPTRGKVVSAETIRAKVAANKSQPREKLKLGEKMGFSRNETGPSDVGLNDPNDPATRGKLKDLLSKDAINFNERERGVLEKILKEE